MPTVRSPGWRSAAEPPSAIPTEATKSSAATGSSKSITSTLPWGSKPPVHVSRIGTGSRSSGNVTGVSEALQSSRSTSIPAAASADWNSPAAIDGQSRCSSSDSIASALALTKRSRPSLAAPTSEADTPVSGSATSEAPPARLATMTGTSPPITIDAVTRSKKTRSVTRRRTSKPSCRHRSSQIVTNRSDSHAPVVPPGRSDTTSESPVGSWTSVVWASTTVNSTASWGNDGSSSKPTCDPAHVIPAVSRTSSSQSSNGASTPAVAKLVST